MLSAIDWIVIPGGPGLSGEYLQFALEKSFTGCNLHYYRIHGEPESRNKNPDISQLVNQISHTASQKNLGQYGLITHSFGNYLAIRALEFFKDSIQAIIMLNPMPFNFGAWQSALANIASRVPQSVMVKIEALSKNPDQGVELFNLIYPYYIGEKNAQLPVKVQFDINACNNIAGKVRDYNDNLLISSTSTPIVRIVGEKDPFFSDQDALPEQTIVLPGVGHYPFFEDPIAFATAIKKAEGLLCHHKKKINGHYFT